MNLPKKLIAILIAFIIVGCVSKPHGVMHGGWRLESISFNGQDYSSLVIRPSLSFDLKSGTVLLPYLDLQPLPDGKKSIATFKRSLFTDSVIIEDNQYALLSGRYSYALKGGRPVSLLLDNGEYSLRLTKITLGSSNWVPIVTDKMK